MSNFIVPMTAQKMKGDFSPSPGVWSMEEKYDGHRLCIAVNPDARDLFGKNGVRAWSRNEILRPMPPHLMDELDLLPSGVYDAELLIPGRRSYGVTVVEDSPLLIVQIFDVMEALGTRLTKESYTDRRRILQTIFTNRIQRTSNSVRLADCVVVNSREQVDALAKEIWARDGEGLMLKRNGSLYQPGKRSKDWLKVKKLQTVLVQIIGFMPGLSGPCSTVLGRDDEGTLVSVKVLNDYERMRCEKNQKSFIGKGLWIEYQEQTPDKKYRHPMWDRWEDE